MKIDFDNSELEQLAFDPIFIGKWNWKIKKEYQEVLVAFKAINRRENFYPLTGMRFEQFHGKRQGQRKKKCNKEYSVRLDGRYRVLFTFVGPSDDESIIITFVGDPHRG